VASVPNTLALVMLCSTTYICKYKSVLKGLYAVSSGHLQNVHFTRGIFE
jgi:hypothetical protein